jgi:uncharacterized protein DUF5655/uncharacterized protein DUF4287
MAKSPQEMKAAMIAGLPEKTGKSLDEWRAIIQKAGLGKHKEIVTLLKTKHGVTHGYANMIALQHLQTDSHTADDADALVAAQYFGAKAGLKPIYESIIGAVKKFGQDVEVAPKKAYVSVRRNKQFAIVQPSTATRVDVGLVLKGVGAKGRLEPAGSFNAMVTHRVRIEKPTEVDKELMAWLTKAYEEA